jgi:hypothetical protein
MGRDAFRGADNDRKVDHAKWGLPLPTSPLLGSGFCAAVTYSTPSLACSIPQYRHSKMQLHLPSQQDQQQTRLLKLLPLRLQGSMFFSCSFHSFFIV